MRLLNSRKFLVKKKTYDFILLAKKKQLKRKRMILEQSES